MNNSINNEDFYPNLNSMIKVKIQEVYKTKGLCELSSIISIMFYLALGLLFIYMIKDIIFTSYYFFNLNLLFKFCKILIIISGAIFITSYINKIPKNTYNKSLISLRQLFVLDICNCNSKCNCKNSVLIYLKNQGINLLF